MAPVAHVDLHEVQAVERLPVLLPLTDCFTLSLSPSCVKIYNRRRNKTFMYFHFIHSGLKFNLKVNFNSYKSKNLQ